MTIQYRNACYSHYYLCAYLPVSAGRDTLSRSLLRFKRGLQPDLNGWIDCSLEILNAGMLPADPSLPGSIAPDQSYSAASPLVQASSVPDPGRPCPIIPGSTILRALHHDETAVAGNAPVSLDQLGSALASRFQCLYSPSLLHKSRPTREVKGLTRQQRETELRDLYYIDTTIPNDPSPGARPDAGPETRPTADQKSHPPFLIIDDVLTTATTIRTIIGAVLRHYPYAPLSVFTLAKADYDSSLNSSTPLKGQNYRLEQGTDWLLAEETPVYYSRQLLKDRIWAGVL
jgi:hypothetical protein